MSIEIHKTAGYIPSDDLYSALRRVFYKFSCGGVVHERDFAFTCRYVSALLDQTKFQDLVESVQDLFVNVIEVVTGPIVAIIIEVFLKLLQIAVIVFITSIFPIVRSSILCLSSHIPESCQEISSLFDLLDVQVTKCCGYILQLRMAAIDQLLQSDEIMVATLPKSLDLSLFGEKCHSTKFETSSNVSVQSSLQPQNLFKGNMTTDHASLPFVRLYSASPTSSGQMDPLPLESPFPTWSTPRSSSKPDLAIDSSLFPQDFLGPNFNIKSDPSIRAAAERELALCANLLYNSPTTDPPTTVQFSDCSAANHSNNESTPSPVARRFFVDMKNISPTCPSALAVVSQSPPHRTSSVKVSPNHQISSMLQIHDHSQQSSIDLALVPGELLKPDVINLGSILRRPLSHISTRLNVPSNPMGQVPALESSTVKLSRAEAEDLFGYAASSSPESAQEGEDALPVTRVPNAALNLPSGPTTPGRSNSPAGHTTANGFFVDSSSDTSDKMPTSTPDVAAGSATAVGTRSEEFKTPGNEKRKRQPSVTGSKGRSQNLGKSGSVKGADTGRVRTTDSEYGMEHRDSLGFGGDHLRRSKRQRAITAQKQGLDIKGLALPGAEITASPGRRSTSSNMNKENNR